MNSNVQAQKGFKTFLLTLVISLVVFSAIYYVINSGTSSQPPEQTTSQETEQLTSEDTIMEVERSKPEVKNSVVKEEDTATLGDTSSRRGSVFGDLANSTVEGEPQQVLAGSTTSDSTSDVIDRTTATTETNQSTVPVTGVTSPTTGVILSALVFSLAFYIIFLGPRKLALSSFEKKVMKDLD